MTVKEKQMENKRLVLIVICIAVIIATVLIVYRMLAGMFLKSDVTHSSTSAITDSSTANVSEGSSEVSKEESSAETNAPESQAATKEHDDTVYTESDIEKMMGTSVTVKDASLLKTDCTMCYCKDDKTNNYQDLAYYLFDTPDDAEKMFEKLRTGWFEESSLEDSGDFLSGREKDVMDASIDCCFLLRGNMIVSASAVYSCYYDIKDEEKIQAQNAESRKNYEELKEWLQNEF